MASMVLLTGAPGTGKSTLADGAAAHLSAPILAWDWIMGSFTGFEELQAAFREMDRGRYRAVGWEVAWNLAVAQLRNGRSVVLDGVARDSEVVRFREIASSFGVRSCVVWTMCSDPEIHRSRVTGRRRGIPGWHELEWSHVEAVRTALAEPSDVDLRLDAVHPLQSNLEGLLDALRA